MSGVHLAVAEVFVRWDVRVSANSRFGCYCFDCPSRFPLCFMRSKPLCFVEKLHAVHDGFFLRIEKRGMYFISCQLRSRGVFKRFVYVPYTRNVLYETALRALRERPAGRFASRDCAHQKRMRAYVVLNSWCQQWQSHRSTVGAHAGFMRTHRIIQTQSQCAIAI